MPSEGSGTRMGAQVLALVVSPSVLSVVPARGTDPVAARYRAAVLGRSVRRDRGGRQTGGTTVQHRRAGRLRLLGRMVVPHAHVTRARRHAIGRHVLQEPRRHTHRRPLQGIRFDSEVSAVVSHPCVITNKTFSDPSTHRSFQKFISIF